MTTTSSADTPSNMLRRQSGSAPSARRFTYGGQAVIEGVMMRGQRSAAVAVRAPSGAIVLHEEIVAMRRSVARWPLVRGVVLLWEMLVLGSRMMMLAASIAQGETQGQPVAAHAPEANSGRSEVIETESAVRATDPRLMLTMLVSLGFAVGLFFLLPLGAVGAAQRWIGTGWLSLAAEGLLRLALLIGYLVLIGRLAEVRRVFEYHGAEHKAINTLEAGQPLDVAHVRRASRVHTRCGTGFLLIVVVLSIAVFALVGNPPLALRVLSRIVLVPVIAALAYELMRLGAANYRYAIVRLLMAPSLALQGLTTREPDDAQIECALAALERVRSRDSIATPEVVI